MWQWAHKFPCSVRSFDRTSLTGKTTRHTYIKPVFWTMMRYITRSSNRAVYGKTFMKSHGDVRYDCLVVFYTSMDIPDRELYGSESHLYLPVKILLIIQLRVSDMFTAFTFFKPNRELQKRLKVFTNGVIWACFSPNHYW